MAWDFTWEQNMEKQLFLFHWPFWVHLLHSQYGFVRCVLPLHDLWAGRDEHVMLCGPYRSGPAQPHRAFLPLHITQCQIMIPWHESPWNVLVKTVSSIIFAVFLSDLLLISTCFQSNKRVLISIQYHNLFQSKHNLPSDKHLDEFKCIGNYFWLSCFL